MSVSFLYPTVYRYYDEERRDRAGGYYTMSNATGIVPPDQLCFNYVQHYAFDYTSHRSLATAIDVQLMSFANGLKFVWKSYLDDDTGNTFDITGPIYVYDKNNNDISDSFYMQYRQSTSKEYILARPYKNEGVSASNLSFELSYWNIQYTETVADAVYAIRVDYPSLREPHHTPVPLSGVIDGSDYRKAWNGSSFFPMTSDEQFRNFKKDIEDHGDGTPITPIKPSEDTSDPGGGDDADPDYNPFSDPVDFPGLPTGGSAIASGFIRVYNPTAGQLQSLAGKLWGNDFVNTIHKIMNDPMEAMISLHSVPFQIVGGANANIEVGNFDTEVSAKTVTTQYYTLDCGNISLPEHWASALDYSPYTTVDIFIPFVGVRSLQIDDVMNRVLNLKYNIDILTGSAVAMLKCGDSVLYTYNTQVHTEIPYTMSSYGRLVQSIIGIAGTAIGATAGGAGAIIGGSIGGALGTAMTKHSDVSRGGALGGAVGVMGDFTPYLIIHRPIQSLAGDFASKKGYPSNISATLGSVSGYTVVDKIHLTGIDCTDTERDEIHALLKDGVII